MGVALKKEGEHDEIAWKITRTLFSPIRALKNIVFLTFIRARSLDERNFVQPKVSLYSLGI
jgi:hypothetical protein